MRSDLLSLERAAALYRGPFLDGLSLVDSPVFEEWMLLQDEEIRRNVLSLLDCLKTLQMRSGATAQAARWARRQLELEPYREQAHRQLMTALALCGERSAALEHYEACRRLLANELNCEPEDETLALYAKIWDGALPRPLLTSLAVSESSQQSSSSARVSPRTGRFCPCRLCCSLCRDYQKSLEAFRRLINDFPGSKYRELSEALLSVVGEAADRNSQTTSQKKLIESLEKQVGTLEKQIEGLQKQIEQMKEIDRSLEEKRRKAPAGN